MIEAGQDPIDMLHVTDLYTTAARVAKAIYRHLHWLAPTVDMMKKHRAQIQRYPHTKLDPMTGAVQKSK